MESMNIKRLFLLLAVFPLLVFAEVKIEAPKTKQATAFAIITDDVTYGKTKEAIEAYRDATEADGLSTYIVSSNWKSPDEVKAEIQKIYKGNIPLEGIVLVGDVPIALIRNAQHMTTAFKMNEDKFPIQQSSVPSDRFYDDLNLTFDYLEQDTKQPLHFYYKLREDSPQKLNPSFYSARIKYPEKRGGDKYEAIASFLRRATADKLKRNLNYLDSFVSYTGSAYNSECLIAWRDEEKALKEYFPYAWSGISSAKFMNFRMADVMKYKLFNELQRKDVDVFMFHEHGTPNLQLINNDPAADSFASQYKNVRSSIYAEARKALRGKKLPLDSIKSNLGQKYSVSESFFDELLNKELFKADSIKNADVYINLADLKNLNTYPKFVMFDACYNGSFHEDDYVAGYYIFNDGNTLVTQGNTRNVLQDRWTIEMIGILSHGARVGQYNRLVATLEGHLIGDPTVHFTPRSNESLKTDMVLYRNDTKVWENYLKSTDPSIQAVALRYLVNQDVTKKLAPRLLDVFKISTHNTVRMEALKLLSRYGGAQFTEAVSLALSDPYELIARQASIYAGKIGDPILLKPLASAYINQEDRARVSHNANRALLEFATEDVVRTQIEVLNESNILDKDDKIKQLSAKKADPTNQSLKTILDKSAKTDARINEIRTVRNFNYHYNLDDYFSVLSDTSDDVNVRIVLAETLGWFTTSFRKNEIINKCKIVLADKATPEQLKLELEQTINRLK